MSPAAAVKAPMSPSFAVKAPMRRLAAAVALAACLWSNVSVAAPASCDAPSFPPTEASVAAGPGDTRIHVLIGMVGTCQVALREFRVALPALHGNQQRDGADWPSRASPGATACTRSVSRFARSRRRRTRKA